MTQEQFIKEIGKEYRERYSAEKGTISGEELVSLNMIVSLYVENSPLDSPRFNSKNAAYIAHKAYLNHGKVGEYWTILDEKRYALVSDGDNTTAENSFTVDHVDKELASPPKAALLLLYLFYGREYRESILGDMEQDFQEAIELFGLRTAQWLYWKGVFASLPSSVIAFLVRWASAIFSKFVG